MVVKRNDTLAEYRRASRRKAWLPQPSEPARPRGEVIWVHAGTLDDLPALVDLSERLAHERIDTTVLITLPEERSSAACVHSSTSEMICVPAPVEHPDAIHAFLDHWRPDVCLWVWGGFRPNLVDLTHDRGIPMHLISADTAGFDARRDRWFPELARHLLNCFDSASARTPGCARRLARLGMPPKRITVQPSFQPMGHVPECADTDLEELNTQLNGRPVWFAASLGLGEWHDILDAHLLALRSAHRLLVVVNPTTRAELEDIRAFLDRYGLSHASWDDGELPTESTQVLLTETAEDAGLWYRVAAATFLGQSLSTADTGIDPLPAAQLGCAIVHGPGIAAFTESYDRLRSAKAARMATDPVRLGAEIADLIVPEHSATMAFAGWDVVTESAEVVDSIIELVQDSLEPPARDRL